MSPARTLPAALLLLAALAADGRAEEASEEKLLAVEMAADQADRQRVLREREALAKSDEDVAAICRVLDNTKIDLDFTDASLDDIIGFIREYAKINIEIDQRVREEGLAEKKITFRMREAVLSNVLDLLLRQYNLGYTFSHRVMLITLRHPWVAYDFDPTPQRNELEVPPLEGVESAEADERIRKRIRETKISLGFSDCSLSNVLTMLTEYTRIPFVVEAGSVNQVADRKITFRVDELPFEQAFDLILKMLDMHYFVQAGAVHIVATEDLWTSAIEPDGPEIASRTELSPLGKNEQGCDEFRHERTGIVLVHVPEGEYRTIKEDGAAGWRTVRQPFLISKTEVTNAQFRQFAEWRRYLPGHRSGSVAGLDLDRDDQPVVGVSWYEVQGYCELSGLRLPTEQEWEKVASGGDSRRFPWGNEWPPPVGAGNYADALDDGTDGLEPVLGRRRDGHLSTAPVGRATPNPFGVHDLGGNVWEWCAGPVSPPGFKSGWHSLRHIFDASGAILRGGGWTDYRTSLLRCSARLRFPPDRTNPAVGFRVAMDAPR